MVDKEFIVEVLLNPKPGRALEANRNLHLAVLSTLLDQEKSERNEQI